MNNKKVFLKVKDHSVSGEEFELIENPKFGFLQTHPKPEVNKLPEYYKSEDYISHTDTKRNLFEKAYHLVRSVSLKRKLKLINSFIENKTSGNSKTQKTILDVGCGTGDFLKTAQDNGWLVSGIEPNDTARKSANLKTNNAAFNTEQFLKFNKNSFDVITLWHVLEHLPNLEEHISILKSLLKPNGTLIIAVPNYKSFDAKYYKQFWAALDVPRHLWHFNKLSVSNLLASINMKVVKVLPMKFDAFYVALLSEKYKSGKMKPLKGFWIGLQSNLKAKRSGEYSSLIYVVKNN